MGGYLDLVTFYQAYIGDIIISYNFMNKPKSKNIKNFKEKVVKTFIHGYLHLLGFDHIKDKDYRKMISQEEKIYKSVISKINQVDKKKIH